ncbi:MAG: hypothetical protein DCC64_04170 [Planctomycetota bacterium]|nr:MAG: hypothetical protein DCC64_04170 [Planctomycetota bacterium]
MHEPVSFGWLRLEHDFAPSAERLWVTCTHWAHFSDLLWGALFLKNHVKRTPQFACSFSLQTDELSVADLTELAPSLFPKFDNWHLGDLEGLANHDPEVPLFELFRDGGKYVKGFDPILITASCETLEQLLGSTARGHRLLVSPRERFFELFSDLSPAMVDSATSELDRCFSKLQRHAITVLQTSEPALKAFPVFSSCMSEVRYCEKRQLLMLPQFGQIETMEFTHEFGKSDEADKPADGTNQTAKATSAVRRAYKDHLEKVGLPKCQVRKLFGDVGRSGELVRKGKFIYGYNVVSICGLTMPSEGEDFDILVIDCASKRIRFAECKFRWAELAFRYFRSDRGIVDSATKQIEDRTKWLTERLPQFSFAKEDRSSQWNITGGVITNQFPVGYHFVSQEKTPNLAVLGSKRARAFFLDGQTLC